MAFRPALILRGAATACGFAALAGCGHDAPYTFAVEPSSGPFQAGQMARLTFNLGDDLDPAWLPDGSAFLYTSERTDRIDHDRCFALMAATGGTVLRRICNTAPAADDSLDVFGYASPGPAGRLAFVYTTFDLRRLTPYRSRDLVVGTLDSPLTRTDRLYDFPYKAPGGFPHYGASHIRWLSPTSFVYTGITDHYPEPCKDCRPDALTPIQLVVVDFSAGPVTRPLPNTIYASSVVSPDPDTVLYTVLGDSRVYRQSISTGMTDVAFDFGFGVIARDIDLRGDRLVAVVGGDVNLVLLPGLGYVQYDDGGEVHVVSRLAGTDSVVNRGGPLLRHLALSPDGRVLLAESNVGGSWDIWRVELP